MERNFSIDWVTASWYPKWLEGVQPSEDRKMADLVARDIAHEIFDVMDDAVAATGDIPAIKFYKYGYRVRSKAGQELRVFIPFEIERQKILIQASGMEGRKVAREIVALASGVEGLTVTRVDLTWDFVGFDTYEFRMLANEILRGSSEKRTTVDIDSSTGSTVYIGSRRSERMLRVYDKGAEQKLGIGWFRFELECKGDLARAIGRTTLPPTGLGARLLLEMLPNWNGEWRQYFEDEASGVRDFTWSERRVKGKTERWLLGDVRSAWKKLIREHPEVARDVLQVYLLDLEVDEIEE